MLLYYRFSSEHAGSYRQCALSSSALSLRETKQLLANECGLAGEYLRKIDFRIFVAGEKRNTQHQQHVGSNSSEVGGGGVGEEELVEVVDEHQMIHAYSHLVVQRVGLVGERVGGVYVHTLAKRQLSKEAWRSEEEIYLQRTGATKVKKPVPPEWLCGLCGGVMTQPVLVKCLGSCTQSACRSCLEAALRAARGSCPFCGAGFRQVIRNKRLEEIINHANLQEFEIPAASAAPHQKAMSRAASAREKSGRGGDDAGARGGAGGGGGTGSSSEDSGQKGGTNAALLRQQTAVGRGEVGGAGRGVHVKGTSCDSSSSQPDGERGESAAEAPCHHFVYLLPQKNLQLMRARDMMLVDGSSALFAALTAALSSSAQSGDDAAAGSGSAAAGSSPSGGLAGGDSGESDADLEGHDAFLVPLCASGGGTSFSIGGFVRINSHNKVDIATDRVAQSVARQWQQVSNVATAAQGGDDYSATENIFVYRVNWLEKYGTMPMLPSRKQPLGGLVGASRRLASTGYGLSSSGNSNFVPGLIQRSLLPCATLEVVVAASKYEDVLASIRDYAQFGSRPTDPWQYPASNSTAAAATVSAPANPSAPGTADAANCVSSVQGTLPAVAHRAAHTAAADPSGGVMEVYTPPVPPPPPPLPPGAAPLPSYHGHRIVLGEAVAVSGENGTVSTGTAAAFAGAVPGGGAPAMFSRGAVLDGNTGNVVTQQVVRPEGESTLHVGIPASLGPPPLDLYGGPGDEANPYMGYCAILPFLTEEQFWHIRRMQKKAIRLCGYKRPVCSSSTSSNSSTTSSTTSSKEGRDRRRGVVRSYKRRRHRVSSTESSTGSDSSYGSTNSEEQQKGHEPSFSKGNKCRPGEVTSKEDVACGRKLAPNRVVQVSSGEITSTSQTPRESRVDEGQVRDQGTTDTSATSLQRRESMSTPALKKDIVNVATSARARSVAGKPLPVVPPPLSTKHAGNPGSPTTGASLSAKAREEIASALRAVKPEP